MESSSEHHNNCSTVARQDSSKYGLLYVDVDIDRAAQEARYFLDMDEVERQFGAHWESTGKQDFKKGLGQAFSGFTKRKYGQVKHGRA